MNKATIFQPVSGTRLFKTVLKLTIMREIQLDTIQIPSKRNR